MAHSIVRIHSYIVDSSKKWSPGVQLHEIQLERERERWMRKGGVHSIVQSHSYVVG